MEEEEGGGGGGGGGPRKLGHNEPGGGYLMHGQQGYSATVYI